MSKTDFGKLSISARRQTYPFEERLKMYSPENLAKQLEEKETAESKLIVGGVNVLNKRNMDTSVAIDRMRRRKEMHNRVERQRRDCLNQLMDELIDLVPQPASETRGKSQHRANGLRQTAEYIRELSRQNQQLRMENEYLRRQQSRCPSPVEPITPRASPISSPGSPSDIVRPMAIRYTGTDYPQPDLRYTSAADPIEPTPVDNTNACAYNKLPSVREMSNAHASGSFSPFGNDVLEPQLTQPRTTSGVFYPYSNSYVTSNPARIL